MTIRYKCEECESVLKIRDELAGTDGKCPKCKSTFVVPEPEKDLEEPLDLPRAVTPGPDFSRLIDIQHDPGTEEAAQESVAADDAPKPSIAELMREHEEKKARKSKRRDKSARGGLKEAADVAEVVTSGSAADVITRNYDQRRDTAGEPPPMTREERREQEQKEAFVRFLKFAGPVLVGVLLGLYGLYYFVTREAVPPLYAVEWIVTLNNVPQEGVEVRFSPDAKTDEESGKVVNQNSSRGYTDAEGKYYLEFTRGENRYTGAVSGKHSVFITDPYGIEYGAGLERTVEEDDNVIHFHLESN